MPSSLRTFPYARTAGAMALGTLGGWLFSLVNVPLAWMLGSIAACLVAAIVRLPVVAPPEIRPPVSAVLGTLIGVSFTPEILQNVGAWMVPLLGMLVVLALSAVSTVIYFRRVAGYDLVTAYFAGMPGGLAEMVLMGDEMGGDPRKVALVHAARILMVVITVPFIAQFLIGTAFVPAARWSVSIVDAPLDTWIWFIATALVGVVIGHVLRLPAKFLLGPMLASLIVHALGWNAFVPPFEVVFAAQVVMGATIGCRFVGTPVKEIFRVLGYSVGSFVILMLVAGGTALGVSMISGHHLLDLLLAYAPGGLGEMSLVALALHLEVAFIATHHIFRVLMVNVGASLVARVLGLDKARLSAQDVRAD